jgi:hypothetical protein
MYPNPNLIGQLATDRRREILAQAERRQLTRQLIAAGTEPQDGPRPRRRLRLRVPRVAIRPRLADRTARQPRPSVTP